jgi:excinuclease UvrABC ATPase subunit
MDGFYAPFYKLILCCNIDNYIWHPTYDNFVQKGSKCPKCAGSPRLTEEERKTVIDAKCLEKDYAFISFTNNINTKERKFKLRCNTDQFEWVASYANFITHDTNCPKCAGLNNKSSAEATDIINQQCINKNYTFIGFVGGVYKNARTNLVIRCNKHNANWFVKYTNFITQNNGCPTCKSSKGEILIRQYLIDNNITYIPQYKFDDCINKRSLSFDFFIPKYNCCIEFDGIQHFQKFSFEKTDINLIKRQENDKIKTDYCKEYKINLLRISYKDDILSKLKSNLSI